MEEQEVVTEEVVVEPEVPEQPEPEPESVEVDPVEAKARQQGWVDKDEWVSQGKPPEDWRSHEIFLERGEFMRKTSNLSKENKRLKETLKDLAEQNKRVAEFEREKAIKELRAQKVQAMKDDDHELAADLDDKIQEVRSMPTPEVKLDPEPDKSDVQESVNAWISRNQWYANDLDLQKQANILMAGYRAFNGNATPDELFAYTEREIRKAHPDKFRAKTSTQKVAGGERTTIPAKKSAKALPRLSDLDFEHQKIAKNFAEIAGIPVEETIKQWVDLGEI